MTVEERSLSPVEESVPRFVLTVGEMQHRIQELQAFVNSQMVKDVDYGVIPGTKKPTLYKPGAEKLAAMYGFAQHAEVVQRIEDWDREFFDYEVRVELINKRTGVIEAQGVGSANSRETRYRWRWVPEKDVPQGVDKSTLTKRTGKYGPLYRVDNENPADVVNTVLKMAKKRALVDAVLSATRSSGLFTQDAEDFPDPADVDVAEPTERTRNRIHEAAAKAARPESPAQAPKDPHQAVRFHMARLHVAGRAVGDCLEPFGVVEVSALAPEQAARLAGILAEMADGTPVPSVRDRIADDIGGRD